MSSRNLGYQEGQLSEVVIFGLVVWAVVASLLNAFGVNWRSAWALVAVGLLLVVLKQLTDRNGSLGRTLVAWLGLTVLASVMLFVVALVDTSPALMEGVSDGLAVLRLIVGGKIPLLSLTVIVVVDWWAPFKESTEK